MKVNVKVPFLGLNVPGGQARGVTAPAKQYEPVGHVLFALRSVRPRLSIEPRERGREEGGEKRRN